MKVFENVQRHVLGIETSIDFVGRNHGDAEIISRLVGLDIHRTTWC